MNRLGRSRGLGVIGWFALAAAVLAWGCSDKDDYNPPPVPPDITLAASFNQVPTDLSEWQTAQVSVVDADGTSGTRWALRVSDWVDQIVGSQEASGYLYDFVDGADDTLLECLGGDAGQLPGYEDLQHAFFIDDSANDRGLRLVWDEQKPGCFYPDNLEAGSVVSRPDWTVLDKTACSYVMETNTPVPVHEGETVYVEGIATMGTDVMVSGRYFKLHIQDETGGIYVFADTQATVADQGYDGSTFSSINIYPGDRVALKGTIGSHDGMVEFYPVSGYNVSVLSRGETVPDPYLFASVDAIYGDGYAHVGDLVRVNGVAIEAVDPASAWPLYGQKSSDLFAKTGPDVNALEVAFYPGSGIPGSTVPAGPFDLIGVLHREETDQGAVTCILYPRGLTDINPLAPPAITGIQLSVYKAGDPEHAVTVSLGDFQQSLYDRGEGAEPVVTLDSLIVPQVARDPKDWAYKIIARDGRQPFDSLQFNQLKSGMLYLDGEVVNSDFYAGMELSQIYYLNDVAEIVLYPIEDSGAPEPGEAVHGQGVNLAVNGLNYPVNFEDLPDPDAEHKIALSEFVPNRIMSVYTMDGSFSPEQIRVLYDYRLVSSDGAQECTITWDVLQTGQADMTSGLPAVTGIEGCTVADLFTIEMIRKIIVDDGVQEQTFYWKDLPIVPRDLGDGTIEEVVFFDDVLDAAGITDKTLYDYNVWASDDFGTYFPYGHHHLEDMFFNALTNQGFITDANPGMSDYGGRYSTKAILRIELRPVPQSAPSLFVDDGLGTGWLSDPNSSATCNGCHVKKGVLEIAVNCADCHS
ncbi:MAG: hypothetical protein AB1640_01405 [bacterium]